MRSRNRCSNAKHKQHNDQAFVASRTKARMPAARAAASKAIVKRPSPLRYFRQADRIMGCHPAFVWRGTPSPSPRTNLGDPLRSVNHAAGPGHHLFQHPEHDT